MKALSLRAPWTNAVLYLQKSIENRKWNTVFRGEFLIHASKGMTDEEWESAYDFCEDVLGLPRTYEIRAALGRDDGYAPQSAHPLLRGGIVGRARLVDVVPPRLSEVLGGVESHYHEALRGSGAWRWHMAEQFGFVLEDITPLPFIAWPGQLNFFDVPFDRDGKRVACA